MLVKVYPLIRIVVVYGLVVQSEYNNCLIYWLFNQTYVATIHRKQQRSLL